MDEKSVNDNNIIDLSNVKAHKAIQDIFDMRNKLIEDIVGIPLTKLEENEYTEEMWKKIDLALRLVISQFLYHSIVLSKTVWKDDYKQCIMKLINDMEKDEKNNLTIH